MCSLGKRRRDENDGVGFFRYEDELKDYLDWCRKSGVSGPSTVGVPGLMPRDIRHPLMRNAPRPLILGPGVPRLPAPAQSPQPAMVSVPLRRFVSHFS